MARALDVVALEVARPPYASNRRNHPAERCFTGTLHLANHTVSTMGIFWFAYPSLGTWCWCACCTDLEIHRTTTNKFPGVHWLAWSVRRRCQRTHHHRKACIPWQVGITSRRCNRTSSHGWATYALGTTTNSFHHTFAMDWRTFVLDLLMALASSHHCRITRWSFFDRDRAIDCNRGGGHCCIALPSLP